jgi:hypothetical protein
MSKWIAFLFVWLVGLYAADLIHAAGHFKNTSQIMLFGGVWMILSVAAKEFVASYARDTA